VENFKAKALSQTSDKFYSTTKSTQTTPDIGNNGQDFILQVNRNIYDLNAETSELRDKLTKQKKLIDKLIGGLKLDTGRFDVYFKTI
jgi:hypothetical protein